jgi:predicted nuclease of predicted toxin-antitoxin system
MRILVDECAPSALARFLREVGHDCRTVQQTDWSGKQNGELLELAENQFDVLVTIDTNLQYQQNLAHRKIAILLVRAPSNRLPDLERYFPACAKALERIKPGDFLQIGDLS